MFSRLISRFRIQTILLLSFFALNVILLSILGTVSYRAAADEITNGAAVASLSTLDDAGKRLGLRLDAVEETATSISVNPQLESILQERGDLWRETQAINHAKELLNPYSRGPGVTGMHLIVHGWLIAPANTGGVGLVSDSAMDAAKWYMPIWKFDAGWLGVHTPSFYDTSPDNRVVTYIRKVYSTFQAELLGIVAIDVRLDSLSSVLQGGVGYGPLFITGPNGDFVYQVSGPQASGRELDLVDNQLRIPDSGYSQVMLSGKPTLVLATAPVHSEFRVVQIVPLEQLTTGLTRIRWAFLWGGIACALGSLVMAWALARWFLRPIHGLIQAMKDVGGGSLTVRLPVRHGNEFGALESGFNHMGEHLEQLVADLNDAHRRKRKAELEALQAQINPHFLYNTLDMINWMAIAENKPKISEAVILLARFFRLGLSKGDTLVPLSQELDHLRIYIKLQQIRFKSSFSVEESFSPDLFQYKVPKIVLQPFVENALGHAFANRGGQGTIHLRGAATDGRLILTVADDGVGMAEGALPDPTRVGTGYGIRNVHERIQMNFGPEYGVTIASRPEEGTTVTITLPLISTEGGEPGVVGHAG